MNGALRVAAALLVMVAAALAGLSSMSPPAVRPASAPADLFSAERAMGPLATIASRPHPTGTAAASAVREQLVDAFTRLGFEVTVQDTTSLTDGYSRWGYPVAAGHVRNVVARRAGTDGPPAVLLSAHYDSRELSPGASDDGYGTAVLLETARALSTLPRLRRDLILLVSEGEEQGLLGARAFVAESPLSRDVGVVVNVDSRGDRGPGLMFQTSEHGSDLVETLARVAPRVTSASLSQEVYRRMPNGTDFSAWLATGHAGLDFASIDGFERYHQTTDTVANADPRTVQELGDAVLGLARDLGDRDALPPVSTHDDVYFDAGPLFVRYDARDALPLGVLALAAAFAATVVATRRRLVTARGVLAGLLAAALVPVLAALAGLALVWLAGRALPAITTQTLRDLVRKECLSAALLLGAGIAWACSSALLRRIAPPSLVAGIALQTGALAVATAVTLPGASFTFLWPALASAAALVLRAMRPALPPAHPAVVGAMLVGPALGCLILTPLAWQLGIVFGVGGAPALAAIAAAAVLPGPACVGVPATAPLRAAGAALLVGAVGLLGLALASPPHDASAPQPDSLMYAVDDDRDRAFWLSVDDRPDRWTERVLGGGERAPHPEVFPRQGTRAFLSAPAPVAPHRGPRVAIVSDEQAAGARRLRLHLAFPPETEALEVLVPPAAHVTSAAVQGRSFGPAPDGWLDLAYFGPPEDGLDLELTASGSPLTLTMVAQTRALPRALLAPLGPRPPDLMPEVSSPLRASDMTLVASSFGL